MIGKKHICGYSCAFCEKDIVNLSARNAEFTPWNSMPMRDPNDRIAKVGQGFSKILSVMSPDDFV
jgi:wyosine [tRNA(Phe)-imidazoG37] synthetase (radical SAM superfamily)